jgi:photosystem II stability/assembly factor-like uncharacterized protein
VTRFRLAVGVLVLAAGALAVQQATIASPAGASGGHSSRVARRGLQGFQPASMSFVSTSTGYLLGCAQTTGRYPQLGRGALLARTDDGGMSWTRVPVPKGVQTVNDGAAVITFVTRAVGFIAGRRTFLTTDAAAHWHLVDRGLRIVDVEAAAGKVWALAHPCHGCHGLRLYSADLTRPRLRQVRDAPTFAHGGARFIHGAGNEIYLVTSSKAHRGRIFRSYHGGSWTQQREPCQSFGNFAAWSDAGLTAVCNVILYGVGNETKRAYVSFDGAHSWTRRGAPGEFGYLGELAAGSSDSWVLAESRGAFLATGDDGAHWAYTGPRSGFAEGAGDTQFTSPSHVVAIPDYMPNGTFLSSNDAGQHWHVYHFPKWPKHRRM